MRQAESSTFILDFGIDMSIFTCPEEDIMGGCKDPTMCIYADPNNCHGLIQCTDGGEVFHQNCNVGLEWNDSIKNCDKLRHSTCTR